MQYIDYHDMVHEFIIELALNKDPEKLSNSAKNFFKFDEEKYKKVVSKKI